MNCAPEVDGADRFGIMEPVLRVATPIAFGLALALGLTLMSQTAHADAYYVCHKKGSAPLWTNSGGLGSAKATGFRCRKRMDFGDETPARPARSRSAHTRASGTTGAQQGWAPRRFSGPAGERETYEALIQEAAKRYKVPANLVRAVIRVESNFRPQVVSSAGARGLMQLMPKTAAEMGVSDLFDPRQNVLGGTRYLRLLINRFDGDAKLAIAAYHAGPGVVASRGRIPYKATERYVRSVLSHYLRYKDARL